MKKPNIVFILADDMGSWAMRCAGNKDVQTPNLDMLAAEGLRFENMFCTSPVCSPARASILTGQMPSQHGVHDWLAKGHVNYEEICEEDQKMLQQTKGDAEWSIRYEWAREQVLNDSAVAYLDGVSTYTDLLHNKGYECAMSGKWHVGDAGTPREGFTFWETIALGGGSYYYHLARQKDQKFHTLDHVYITDYVTDNALKFLENRQEDNPFYLSIHYTAPHSPWSEEHHPPEYYALYENTDFPSTPYLPPHPWGGGATLETRRMFLNGYFAAITAMDAAIGRVVTYLKENNLYENTLLIFTADNGMSMGHHGIFGKGNGTFPMNMYDTAVKVPFIATYPAGMPKGGQVPGGLYSHYDIYPTIAALLGETVEDTVACPGSSFLPLLLGEGESARLGQDEIVILDEYGPVRMLRTKTHKYVHRYPYGPHELYDLVHDPDEAENLALREEDASITARMAELRLRMEQWFLQHTSRAYDGKSLEVTGKGQILPIDERGRGYSAFQ